jgi:PAS domain S-box-containing protein
MKEDKNTILVVDDLPQNIQLVSDILKQHYRVLFATDGKSALKMLNGKHVDLILMDIMMPEMDGFETTRRIRDDLGLKEIPIIFLTANADQASLIKGYEHGAVDFIPKPFNPVELKLRVKTQLELYTTKEQLKKYLEENQLVLRQYKEAVDECTIVSKTDIQGIITYVNDEFCRISGYSREELLGKPHNIVRHIDMPKGAFNEMWQILKSKKSWSGIIKNRSKNGDTYIVKALVKPILNSNGDTVEYMAIRQDITEIYHLQHEIVETQKEIIEKIGELAETRSKETGYHVRRVAEYSALLARLCNLSIHDIDMIKMASPMHDVGKIAIPDGILLKPGKLDESEFKVMQTHAEKGYEVFKNSKRELLQTAAIIAHEHHERWDGKGYPRGIKADKIHIFGRITAVADVFDALGSARIYKEAWSIEDILDFFRKESGKQFDPNLIELFFENLDEFLTLRDQFKDSWC